MAAKKTTKKYTWTKAHSDKVKIATRINNKTKEIEMFQKKNGEWKSLSYPFRKQPKNVQNKASSVASKKKGYNIDRAFKILGKKRK